MAHEFGHDINWPDLYDTDQDGEGVGEWSLMGSGSWGENAAPGHEPGNSPSYPDAYSLYYQGWIMPTVATVADDVAIGAHQSAAARAEPRTAPTGSSAGTAGTGEFFCWRTARSRATTSPRPAAASSSTASTRP